MISCLNPTEVDKAMAKLKIHALHDEKAIKITFELLAAVHRDLVAYARCWPARPDRRLPNQPS